MFTIEKNVPIPSGAGKRGRAPIYPFRQMEVGDSFFVESEVDSKVQSTLTNAAFSISKSDASFRFSVRRVDGGYRVWRIPTTPKLVAAE